MSRADARRRHDEPESPDLRSPDLRLELPATFIDDDGTIVVNFGILTGREATQAEIDRLARLLVAEGEADPDMTILAARRQDYGEGIETVTHQVLVHATGGVPVDARGAVSSLGAPLRGRLAHRAAPDLADQGNAAREPVQQSRLRRFRGDV